MKRFFIPTFLAFAMSCPFALAQQQADTAAAQGSSAKAPLVKVESRTIGQGNTLSGLDVLKQENFRRLKGKRTALLTNHSAIDRDGVHALDLMLNNPNVNLVKLFSPEHGLYGDVDTQVADAKDTATGLMIHSLYRPPSPGRKSHHPAQEDLQGLDLVVVDMQDVGARFYTYCSYMGYMMEECAQAKVEVMVLDRPNPIGGLYVDGPYQDPDSIGTVTAYFPMPTAHGMTMGEMAKMFNVENDINCKLTVVAMKDWKRSMFFDETGLRWVNPSPNIQDLDAAIVYPGIAISEALISMGRGTDEPFHIFGTPYIEDPAKMIEEVTSGGLEGVRLEPAEFTPAGRLARGHAGEGKLCKGARMHITDRKTFRPVELGYRVMAYMQSNYGTKMIPETRWDRSTSRTVETGKMIPQYNIWRVRAPASSWVCARIVEGKSMSETMKYIERDVEHFEQIRSKYLMYR